MAATAAKLPTIIDIIGTSDAGGYGAAICPHCGSDGRYVHTFLCDDGSTRGAMAGCIKLFPQHPVVQKILYYRKKWQEYEKKGWALSRFDQQIADAFDAMRAGQIDADTVMRTIANVTRQRDEWRKRRKYRR